MQAAVAGVVGSVNMREHHKIQLALKYLKSKLTELRSEERRKVMLYRFSIITLFLPFPLQILGHAPYRFMSTRDLGMQIMHQMLVPGDIDGEIYIRHLALFVR